MKLFLQSGIEEKEWRILFSLRKGVIDEGINHQRTKVYCDPLFL